MDSPPKLAGETLIVHHIPLVHCQVPDRQRCPSSKRSHTYGQNDLGITRTTSLPERELSQADSLVYSSLVQASEPPIREKKLKNEEDLQGPTTRKRHNPFLPSEEVENHALSGNPAEESFHLHRTSAGPKSAFNFQDLALPPFHLHGNPPIVKPWMLSERSGLVEGQEEKDSLNDLLKGSNGNQVSSEQADEERQWHQHGGPSFSLDWNQSSDLEGQDLLQSRECSCNGSEGLRHCRCYSASSQSEMDQQVSYVSDSSCNSSDGILVNFSALYNKMNGQPRSNMNSGSLSCDSSFCSHPDTGAFYLDLQASPTESKMSCDSHIQEGQGKPCRCCHHPSTPVLDANCNSYHLHCESAPCQAEGSDLTSCFQSQARLVVATQNYYKLVTCDLSSQSSPSPAGSSITSCSDDHTKGSPVQPTEYFLFQQPQTSVDTNTPKGPIERSKSDIIEGQVYVNVSNVNTGRQRSRSYDRSLEKSPTNRLGSLERMMSCPVKLSEGQVSTGQESSPKRVTSFLELAKSRKKNGTSPPLKSSGDSSLEFSPIPEFQKDGAGILERGEFRSHSLPPMSFLHCMSRTCEGCTSDGGDAKATNPNPAPAIGQMSESSSGETDRPSLCDVLESAGSGFNFFPRDLRLKGDGIGADVKPVFRYSKDQRPTTLPIQPFVFQHHFSKPKTRPLHSHFTASLSQLYGLSGSRSSSQNNVSDAQSSAPVSLSGHMEPTNSHARVINVPGKLPLDGVTGVKEDQTKKPAPDTTRPSPLGSYSPIRSNAMFFQSMDSGSSSSPSPEKAKETQPPRSQSCPHSANLLPFRATPARGTTLPGAAKPTQKYDVSPKLEVQRSVAKREPLKEPSTQVSKHGLPPITSLPLLNTILRDGSQNVASKSEENKGKLSSENIPLLRPVNANHLSPQALKWREYRRRNPLGLDRVHGLAGLSGSLDRKQDSKISRRNSFFDARNGTNQHARLNGRPSALSSSDFFQDYFSLTERPPAEFCLSPDGSAESVSIDLVQKKGLVKAVNIAVDLIVAHFGTSRDPGVKAKLGNSSVSPNIGHLVLKYLCPAVKDILCDGLKPWVLDVIIGQRRNVPWTVVEASTQLGPSTKLLHSLCCKVNQYSDLSNHSLRFNAFIFGLLNIRSLEFWFNHLHNHEDIIWAHFEPVGFLSVSHGVCQPLFEELLLLLQPLSLLPFDLDLLFEHHLIQMSREQQQRKEMLRVKQDMMQSAHSTIQLMRSREGEAEGTPEKRNIPREAPEAPGAERPTGEGAAAAESEEDQKKDSNEVKRDRQAGWWYQLMQSSQVYIEGSSDSARFTRQERRRLGSVGTPKKAPPPREGVVEGAEACPSREATEGERPAKKEAAGEVQKDEKRSWMGSPPESVLNDLKDGKEKEVGSPQRKPTAEAEAKEDTRQPQSSPARKWGHLFGSRRQPKESKPANRPPSGWLSLDKSVLQMVAQTVSAGIWGEAAPETEEVAAEGGATAESPSSQNPRPVQPLRPHAEQRQLDFAYHSHSEQLRCGPGSRNRLMPLKYVPHPHRADT